MLAFCGKRFRVSSRTDSTCSRGQPRRVDAAVHLEQLRCDGSAHAGCQAACRLIWKEAWLRRVSLNRNGLAQIDGLPAIAPVEASAECEYRLLSALSVNSDGRPICQATELPGASCPLAFPTTAQYLRDLGSGKMSRKRLGILARYLRGKFILAAFTRCWARAPWNRGAYLKTPVERLDLRPGETVEVRRVFEILATLDRDGCNRGMEFKAEMFQFCGRRYRVIGRLDARVDEKTCALRHFKTPSIILESAYCQGQRSFCARGNYHYWREIWLRRC